MRRNFIVVSLLYIIANIIVPLGTVSVNACSVPVFRYALERWTPDVYSVVVWHKSELSPEELSAIEALRKYESGGDIPANMRVRLVDVDKEPDFAKGEKVPAPGDARLLVYYPPSAWSPEPIKAWESALNLDSVKVLMESPVRAQLAERLIDGESAVWLILESGDKQKDDTAFAVVSEQLEIMEKEFKLPEIEELGDPLETYYASEDTEPLKITFSVLRISRSDPKEAFLVSALTNSESDLNEYKSDPLVFPVFGRGRDLYALVGKGINSETLQEAGAFITGECSCEIKEDNPGVDILLAADWDLAIDSLDYSEMELPPLVGATSLLEGTDATSASALTDEEIEAERLAAEKDRELREEELLKKAEKRRVEAKEQKMIATEEEMVRTVKMRLLFVVLGVIGIIGVIVLVISFVVMSDKRR